MRINERLVLYIGIMIIMLLGSCRANNEKASDRSNLSSKEENKPAKEVNVLSTAEKGDEGPQIIFLNYSIKRNAAGSPEIRFINKIVADGKLKKNSPENQSLENGDLICIELDDNSQPIKRINISNPLSRIVEYVDESGALAKKTIELDSAQFSVRMQLDANAEAIAIEQINGSGVSSSNLIVTKLR